MKRSVWIATGVFVLLFSQALDAGIKAGLEANAGFWWVLQEEVENGELQAGTRDTAAQEASGFNFKQGRLGVHFGTDNGKLEGVFRIRLEERMDIIDCYGIFHAAPWMSFYVGQMKIPSTREVLKRDHMTDFVTRTTFAQNVGDFSLAKTPYISSLMNAWSLNRDLGIAVKGQVPDRESPFLNYYVMVGNGAGAGRYTGGKESSEFFYTNNFGDYYYGGRLEISPWDWLMVGGHMSRNRHEDAIIQDKKTVVDLEREVWTADLELRAPWGTRLYGFYGEGWMEDYFFSQDYEFDYHGWGCWLVQELMDGKLELAARYDTFTTEFQKDGYPVSRNNTTYGINWRPNPSFRLQVNYKHKETECDYMEDLDDDLLVMNMQYIFDTWQ
ncbi:MAG: porin [bacterium]